MSAGQEYTPPSVIGIVTALQEELNAIYAVFGIQHDPSRTIVRRNRRYNSFEVSKPDGDFHQIYVGEPCGQGTNKAAIATTNLLNDFPDIQDVVLVGIAGAVPNPTKVETHVRLGDVVMLGDKGVIQVDFIKLTEGIIEYRHDPRPPSQRFLDVAQFVQRLAASGNHLLDCYLAHYPELYRRPDVSLDVLRDDAESEPTVHPHDLLRKENSPRLFVGPIGSGNILLKDVGVRNRFRKDKGVLVMEMESSGCADACQKAGVRFFAIRGTCDYCNPDKGDDWHLYAAYVAAATLHCILQRLPGTPRKATAFDQIGAFDLASAELLQQRSTAALPPQDRRESNGSSPCKYVDTAPIGVTPRRDCFTATTGAAEAFARGTVVECSKDRTGL